MTKIVRVLRIWLAEELRILAFRLDPEPDLARDRKIWSHTLCTPQTTDVTTWWGTTTSVNDLRVLGCTHPRSVPRDPCPKCSRRDPLTARWG